jgi:ribosome assembly protein YihI (activator of Der GTPase)
MPYDAKSGQAQAVFLSIKRSQGLAAAKAFGRKHRKELSAAAKNRGKNHKRRGHGYKSRKSRGQQAPPAFLNGMNQ